MMKTDEDRNVIGVLGGCLGFSESDDNVSEVSGAGWSLGVWLVQCQNLRGWLEQSRGSGRGIDLGSDGLLAIRWGSQQLNSLPSLKAKPTRPCM